MDGFAFHPYGINSSAAVDLRRPNPTTSRSSTRQARALLGKAFDGTAQVGSGMPILYDEYGIESIVPQEKAANYVGTEPATTRPVERVGSGRGL